MAGSLHNAQQDAQYCPMPLASKTVGKKLESREPAAYSIGCLSVCARMLVHRWMQCELPNAADMDCAAKYTTASKACDKSKFRRHCWLPVVKGYIPHVSKEPRAVCDGHTPCT